MRLASCAVATFVGAIVGSLIGAAMGVQFWQGKVLFVGGQVAMHERCCCKRCCAPCTTCGVAQPSVTVTVAGGCDGNCSNAAGTYAFTSFTNYSSSCEWVWIKGTPGSGTSWEMYLRYTPSTGRWWCLIAQYDPAGNFEANAPEGICCDCDTGHLKGQFAVPGINGGFGVDCTGCTAMVTLGG
jgi:hypothetical protein